MAKKILLTGSNGLLGQKLVELVSQNSDYELIATSRGENRLSNKLGYTYHSLDITDKADVELVMDKFKPEFVINSAAMTNVDQCETQKDECWQLNVRAVEYIAEACQKHKSFLLHVSTDFIFDGEDGPYDEEAIPKPISYYGTSKLAAERILMKSKIDWAIARTVLVYGIAEDMSRTNIVLWVKKSLEDKKTIQVVNDQWRTPTLAEDLALGCFLIIQKEATGIYNISGSDFLSPYQMAIKTAEYFNLDKQYIVESDSKKFTQPAKRPPKTGFIIDKAIKNLGYKPHTFNEGIAVLAKQVAVL
ncbi:MAG: SDR family oxidoreductase [Opitutaceae bacterium]|nr:SDR family oxidoreductase [Cytophagales bacterium]